MSTDASDSRGSHCSGTPSLVKNKPEKPPFNLYFSKRQPIGRSDFRVSKLDGVMKFIAKYITPKFYSRGTGPEVGNHDYVKEIMERHKKEYGTKEHRERNYLPSLSSQSYGWWYDGQMNSKDPRFNFHKNTSDMVHSNIMIQWEDQKFRGLHN